MSRSAAVEPCWTRPAPAPVAARACRRSCPSPCRKNNRKPTRKAQVNAAFAAGDPLQAMGDRRATDRRLKAGMIASLADQVDDLLKDSLKEIRSARSKQRKGLAAADERPQ